MREIDYVEQKKQIMKGILSQNLIEMFKRARIEREAKAAIRRGILPQKKSLDHKK